MLQSSTKTVKCSGEMPRKRSTHPSTHFAGLGELCSRFWGMLRELYLVPATGPSGDRVRDSPPSWNGAGERSSLMLPLIQSFFIFRSGSWKADLFNDVWQNSQDSAPNLRSYWNCISRNSSSFSILYLPNYLFKLLFDDMVHFAADRVSSEEDYIWLARVRLPSAKRSETFRP